MTELDRLQKANDEELAKINKQLEDIKEVIKELIIVMKGNQEWTDGRD